MKSRVRFIPKPLYRFKLEAFPELAIVEGVYHIVEFKSDFLFVSATIS